MSAARDIPTPAESGQRALPVFEHGVGDRHEECLHYDDCLTRWIRIEPQVRRRLSRVDRARVDLSTNDLPARCPVGCESFEPVPAHHRLGLTIYWAKEPRGKHPDDEEEEVK